MSDHPNLKLLGGVLALTLSLSAAVNDQTQRATAKSEDNQSTITLKVATLRIPASRILGDEDVLL
jgi:hypothetical protein